MQFLGYSAHKPAKTEQQQLLIEEILNAQTKWEVLGLPNESKHFKPSSKNIRTAYLDRSKLVHPDKCCCENADIAARLLNTAYQDIVHGSKTFVPHHANTDHPPPPPPKQTSASKRKLRREYDELYKRYRRTKAEELIVFRKFVESESELQGLRDICEHSKRTEVQNRMQRTRTAYVKMQLDSKLSKQPVEIIVKLAKDISVEASIDCIRSWATSGQVNTISRPYYINKFIVANTDSDRPNALARKDQAEIKKKELEKEQFEKDERYDHIKTVHIMNCVKSKDTECADIKKQHNELEKETGQLESKLRELEKDMGQSHKQKRSWFGF